MAHYPFRRVCYATMELQAAQSAYADLHKDRPYHDGTFQSWSADRSRQHPYHYSDGVKFGVAAEDVAPWDDFAREVTASPTPPGDDEEDQTLDL